MPKYLQGTHNTILQKIYIRAFITWAIWLVEPYYRIAHNSLPAFLAMWVFFISSKKWCGFITLHLLLFSIFEDKSLKNQTFFKHVFVNDKFWEICTRLFYIYENSVEDELCAINVILRVICVTKGPCKYMDSGRLLCAIRYVIVC